MKLKKAKNEYNPYFDIYLKHLNTDDGHIERLKKNQITILNVFDQIDEVKMNFTYQEGKWSIAQILQHLIDTERIFCYRALKIVREEDPIIEKYNHESYAKKYKFISKRRLLKDYTDNRQASISLFKTFDYDDLNKSIENPHYKFKVGLIPFIFCGHELHHINIIRKKYL